MDMMRPFDVVAPKKMDPMTLLKWIQNPVKPQLMSLR